MIDQFFPMGLAHYLIGGAAIGAAIGLLYLFTGLVGGMSTLFSATWSYASNAPAFQREALLKSRAWRLAYAAGLILGALIYLAMTGETFVTEVGAWRLLVGGLLIGFGARLSNGCTAGHGICGLASLQLPSLLAVIIFLSTAIAVAHLTQAWGGL
ncbi:YeeE/YedE family protein [Methylomagnum sp.]